MKTLMLCVLSCGLIGFGMTEGAQAGGKGKDRAHEHQEILKRLNLTKEQKEKLEKIRSSAQTQMKALREKKRATRKKMKDAFSTETSKDELKKIHGEMQAIKAQLSSARFERMMAIREILNPDQRKEFHKVKSERWKKRRERCGHWDKD